ncbi:MAG: glycosyltransferase family 2 protein [Clostridiales Family XIII bacterium]|nr:glycosyltransferase family 2 protein [Clostridiales Family XIII bacterium]
MAEPKISIIIPVYNGEKYISRCIDSVLNQTFKDVEILLMNDGSTDHSSDILGAYEQSHPEIVKVYAHANMGVAKTRNKAIRLAQAKYIMFIDQDDFIDRDYCEVYYRAIEDSGCDVVMGGYRRPNANGKIVKKQMPKDTPFYKYMIMAAWAKIHRTDFLLVNDITFFDNQIGEDIIFTLREISAASEIKVIDDCGYNWFYNEESVSNTHQRGLSKNIAALFSLLESVFSIASTDALFEYCVVRTLFYYLLYSGRADTPADFIRHDRMLFQWLEDHYPNYRKNRYVRFRPKGETPIMIAAMKIFFLLRKLRLVKVFARFYCTATQVTVQRELPSTSGKV